MTRVKHTARLSTLDEKKRPRTKIQKKEGYICNSQTGRLVKMDCPIGRKISGHKKVAPKKQKNENKKVYIQNPVEDR